LTYSGSESQKSLIYGIVSRLLRRACTRQGSNLQPPKGVRSIVLFSEALN
jgi:hypothetical protein